MVLDDVVESILIRCNATDLLRCQSVCKPWKKMISTPAFTKTHAKFASNKDEDNSNRKIAMISSLPFNWSEPTYSLHLPRDYYRRWQMGGSCNGLVCLYAQNENKIVVSNPVTRVFRVIQPPAISDIKETRCLGFGYDSSTDDYKVVTAICQHNGDHARVYILSLKSEFWKDYGKVDYRFDDFILARPGILYKGALHWFWLNPDDTSRLNILLVSFDLAKEEFRVIPQPSDTRYVWNYRYKLGLTHGRLCIFPTFSPACGIWVMTPYNSWELFPNEIKDHAIHYMLKDTDDYRITPPPSYYCDDHIQFSRSKGHIPSPMFVQTLVSPYAAGSAQVTHNKFDMSSEARWWYILGEDQQHVGPYAASKLKEHFSSGYITESTLVWAEGQSEWQQLSLVPGLISDIPEQVFSSAVIATDDERPSFLPDGEEELTDDDKTVYKWDESIRAWVPQSMNGQYLCNHQITGSYAYYKKDTKGERHGTPAERTLASSNPMAPPPQCQQQQMDQLKVPPPQRLQQFRPPYNMPQMMNRPPPPPAGMAGQQMWRPPPPQQQMAGGHGHPPMMQMSMPQPPPPQG